MLEEPADEGALYQTESIKFGEQKINNKQRLITPAAQVSNVKAGAR